MCLGEHASAISIFDDEGGRSGDPRGGGVWMAESRDHAGVLEREPCEGSLFYEVAKQNPELALDLDGHIRGHP